MPHSWITELRRLLTSIFIFWLMGLVLGFPLWGIITGFSVYIINLARRFSKFEKWINLSLSQPEDFGGVFDDLAFRIYRIRTRSRNRKKKLTELLRSWQDSSAALPDAAVAIDVEGNITWFNLTASSMLRLHSSDNGRHIGNLLRNPKFLRYLSRGDYKEHLEIASPLDIAKTLNIRVAPYGANQRLILVSDVTHIQALMTMRRDFIANVSHELRTPLTVIMGYLESIKGENISQQEFEKLIDKIENPAIRMKSLIEDLLLLSKLDTGAPCSPESSATINVNAMVKNMLAEAEQLSHGQHTINIDIDEDMQLKGVEKEIYSAFFNLITNAIRYTPEGGSIKVQWTEYGDGASFCVTDTGPGIPAIHLSRLTERFYRIDVGRSRSIGGTGLGLSIVNQVLRRHDAEFHVSSDVGKGSEFCCFFPEARVVLKQSGNKNIAS
jgi:two-component system, OmpR family, phosphate regulon sensor histidine kinase PhoR